MWIGLQSSEQKAVAPKQVTLEHLWQRATEVYLCSLDNMHRLGVTSRLIGAQLALLLNPEPASQVGDEEMQYCSARSMMQLSAYNVVITRKLLPLSVSARERHGEVGVALGS